MFSAIILAGGKGERFGSSIPKPFMSLNGKSVLQYSIDVFEPLVDEIVVVTNKKYKNYKCVSGGDKRSDSVYKGLKATSGDYVIIHDGARPFLRSETVEKIKEHLLNNIDCVDTATPIIDGFVEDGVSISKKGKMIGLTPEGFRRDLLEEAFDKTSDRSWQDEITMIPSLYGDKLKYSFVEGQVFNSKITYPEDLAYAEGIMKFWARPIGSSPDLDKKVLVFGGSGGIGGACCRKLKNCEAPSREEIDLKEKLSMNLAQYDAIIHSAGEYSDIPNVMRINFESCVELVELARKQNWKGNIVFLSSTAATYGRKGIPIYSASKSALNAYIEAMHDEVAEEGIILNAIAPAKVDTRLQEAINPNTPKKEMMTSEYVAEYVLRYIDTDIHGHIIYLRKGFDK
jgi:ribitol-5-phosphate 2-dehydrogenase (NADP+) / D-ribitol-5-phosphate cytidylyltransferase